MRSQPYSWGVDTEDALTHLARKHLTTKALEREVSTLKAELANKQAPQLSSLDLEQEIRMQASELKSEQKEIEFLTNTVRASNEMTKAKYTSYVGKVLAAAGYTGSEAKEQKLRLETKTLEEEWAELNKKKEDRAREKEADAVEYADVTQRLKDLENQMTEDSKTTSSRKNEKDEQMKVRVCECVVCVLECATVPRTVYNYTRTSYGTSRSLSSSLPLPIIYTNIYGRSVSVSFSFSLSLCFTPQL